jgi:glutamine amidotransferase
MCRWLAFLADGEENGVLLSDLMFNSENGLTQQSFHAGFTPSFSCENNAKLNADGYGLGWFHAFGPRPSVFKSKSPLWNDQNALEIARSIKTRCAFGHVRAASPGSIIGETNCHPFKYGTLMFQHNGHIEGFSRIRHRMVTRMKEFAFHNVFGTTDTEHLFALVLSNLADADKLLFTADELQSALVETFKQVMQMLHEANIVCGYTTLNVALTDGHTMVVTRFCDKNPTVQAPSLYYAVEDVNSFRRLLVGSSNPNAGDSSPTAAAGGAHAAPGGARRLHERSISTLDRDIVVREGSPVNGQKVQPVTKSSCFVVASEPLVFCGSWVAVPCNTMIVFEKGVELRTARIAADGCCSGCEAVRTSE